MTKIYKEFDIAMLFDSNNGLLYKKEFKIVRFAFMMRNKRFEVRMNSY